ncbi:MAG: Gx transporter family protein [Clostridia bacterium]|nr:Gx transporter family protein [Clostridia bacterium]
MKKTESEKLRRMTTLSLLFALAMIFSFVESRLPTFIPIPGVKLGLCNAVVIFTLLRLGAPSAIAVSLLRVLLSSILFGNAAAFLYSLAGAALSLFGMILLKKTRLFSPVGISVTGGVLHNIGQLLMAMLVLGTAGVLYYLPVLLIAGTVAGALIGLCAAYLCKRLDLKNK